MKLKVIILGLLFLASSSMYVVADEKDANAKVAVEKSKFCPVCGPEEEMEGLAFSYKYKGQKYSFCSIDCMKAFKNDPEKFLKSDSSKKEAGHEGHDHK